MMRTQTTPDPAENVIPVEARHGVTLTEVLISLMIMSVGVSLVASLFPISVLRSIQATQLTNGAILKYNVEEAIAGAPEVLFDPDGDGNIVEHFRQRSQRNYIVDPVGYYTHADDAGGLNNNGYHHYFGNIGNPIARNNPLYPGAIPRFGGGLTTLQGGTSTRALKIIADTLATQGDGWTLQADAQAVSLVSNGSAFVGVVLPAEVDMTQIPTSNLLLPPTAVNAPTYLLPDPEKFRVVLFSEPAAGGRMFSQAFPLTHIAGQVAYWSEDIDGDGTADKDFNMNRVADIRGLPLDFRVDTDGNGSPDTYRVGRVVLESNRESDFSWMLNVRRRSDGLARSVDVVVRFNNGADALDERLFQCTFGASTTVARRVVGVRNAADGTEPNIRKGKFCFDAVNGIWYRVQDVETRPFVGVSNSVYDYKVTLEEAIRRGEGAGSDQDLDGSDTSTWGFVMFPPGIVDVYPMGSKAIPDRMLGL